MAEGTNIGYERVYNYITMILDYLYHKVFNVPLNAAKLIRDMAINK